MFVPFTHREIAYSHATWSLEPKSVVLGDHVMKRKLSPIAQLRWEIDAVHTRMQRIESQGGNAHAERSRLRILDKKLVAALLKN